jgi:hypothetical protein
MGVFSWLPNRRRKHATPAGLAGLGVDALYLETNAIATPPREGVVIMVIMVCKGMRRV